MDRLLLTVDNPWPDLESGLWRFFSFHACSLDSTLLFSRRFDITLEIIVDYSRNERGVLGWMEAAHAMPRPWPASSGVF